MRVLQPSKHIKILPGHGPAFYLEGRPLVGNDWRIACCEKLQEQRKDGFYVATPICLPQNHKLSDFLFEKDDGRKPFTDEVDWQRHYSEIISKNGCVIFWLSSPGSFCQNKEETNRILELHLNIGEWCAHAIHQPNIRIVVGAEAHFPGLDQIRQKLRTKKNLNFPIYSTLVETVSAALTKAA